MMTLLLRWSVYLLTLCGLCAFAVNYTAWFSSFLFYTVLVLPLFSLLLSLWPLLSLSLSFAAPMQVRRGDHAELRITANALYCPFFLPVTMLVTQAQLSDSGGASKKGIRYQFAPYPVWVRANRMPHLPYLRAAGGIRIPIDTAHTAVIRTEIRSAYMYDFLGLFRFPLRIRTRDTAQKPQNTTASAAAASQEHILRRNATRLYADVTVLPQTHAPRGKLRMWDNSQSTPVPTQRFSEQHEIRTYRPGDALRSVHWKLSAKTDDLLVREPVEGRCSVLAITLDRTRDPENADALYDALDWMLRALCVRDRVQSVVVGWVTPDLRTCTETIYDLDHLDGFYRRMLSDPVPQSIPTHAFASVYRHVDRGYHLDTESCLGTAAVNVMTAGNTEQQAAT